ncbi:uncharacterized protein LOC103514367 [Diaphorina citri]|uniref:Uncharacterized protein LOC103514367 n=1 Tax=Diaphorina citri TaxID=121845 RepID=A0A1S3DBC1_DIACI|nr:uncharacterized protein LOC103514367 [Diaphorina citri]KAI5717521.1 hypothetical protein M8J77_007353 [Diaphorina citri]
MEVESSSDASMTHSKPEQKAPRRRASIRIQTITEEINNTAEIERDNEATETVDNMDQDQPVKRRCSLRPRRNCASQSNSVQITSKRNKSSDTPSSSGVNIVLSSSISKIKSRHSNLETIFEEPLENGIRIFSKTKCKRSLVLNGNITKMKLKNRKTKVKKMNLQKTIKRLRNKITFEDLQKKLNHLGI